MTIDTRTALLNSAEKAARTRGFDGFSYADLAADVGIRKASIHHHFPTKAILSQAVMQRYCDDLKAVCAAIEAAHSTGGARLVAVVDRYRTALNGGKSLCLCVAFSTSRDSLPPDVIHHMHRFRAMMTGWLAQVFEAGQGDGSIADVRDPKAEAAATLALLEGAQLIARAEQSLAPFEAATHLLRARPDRRLA